MQPNLSLPALMGSIMSMRVATASGVPINRFANERFSETNMPYTRCSRLAPPD
jgi:hypothetical protein